MFVFLRLKYVNMWLRKDLVNLLIHLQIIGSNVKHFVINLCLLKDLLPHVNIIHIQVVNNLVFKDLI
jgi:hypothetical protein